MGIAEDRRRDGAGKATGGAAMGHRQGGRTPDNDGPFIRLNPRKFNPNAFWLLRFMNDRSVRFIFLRGGSSSSKSFSAAQTILCQTLLDEENTLVMRKVGASIQKTIYEDYRVAAKGLGIYHDFIFKINCIECVSNGARIDFSGLDDPEKIKGIANYKRLHLEELTEFDLADFKQLRKRLRGREGQQIISTFNPISERHWIKKDLMDAEDWHDIPQAVSLWGQPLPPELIRVKSVKMNAAKPVMDLRSGKMEEHAPDMVVIQSTYLNNFWVVGSPDGKYGFYDEQCIADFERDRLQDPNYYNIYALGEWGVLRTGSEFFGSFQVGRNTGQYAIDPALPVHISVDNNVLPYISVSVWQIVYGEDGSKELRQVGEVCATPPDNSVRKAAALTAKYLKKAGYLGNVYLHGDASTRMRNTIDDEKRSWLDLLIVGLRNEGVRIIDKVGTRNPSVPLTGEFVNAVFEGRVEGVSLSISESCVRSVEDYQAVQKDENGGMLKTKVKDKATAQTYEAHGHLSDTMRYFVYDVCYSEFSRWSDRRGRNLYDSAIQYYNPDITYDYDYTLMYLMPDTGGMAVSLILRRVGEFWNVERAIIGKTEERLPELTETVSTVPFDLCVIECGPAYFPLVRELRDKLPDADIRVLPENASQYDRRIAATSAYVREHVRFRQDGGPDYTAFLDNLLDYNRESGIREAAAAISGAATFMARPDL